MDADTQIFQDLRTGLQHGPLSHRAQLSVDVRDGIVTIAGRVNTLAERQAVERTARRVRGIRTLILKIGAAALPLSTVDMPGISRKDSARTDVR
jgi:osmotically-inducible protein OsmY